MGYHIGASGLGVLALAAVIGVLFACADRDANGITPDDTEGRINAIVDSLTLEQKVAQMIQGEIRHMTPADVRRYGIGSVLNGGGAFPDNNQQASREDWLALADAYHQASLDRSGGGAGIPIMWGTDAVHGHSNVVGATLFPHNIGLGAAHSPPLAARIAAATAREVLATGIDWIFAPTVAVATDYRWGRTYESFGADPAWVADYAGPIVEAMQSEGTIATAKHFLGDGGTRAGQDQGDTRGSLEWLLAQHGPGYEAAIDAGVLTIMASFNSWNGDKVHGHKQLLTDVLKGDMGFEGVVVSDWNGHGQVSGCTNTSCAQAINAGIDIVMVPKAWRALLKNTIKQVQSGQIPISRIDDAVRRILRVKFAAGVMDRGLPSSRARSLTSNLGKPEHRALAREAVRRSLVMLKNDSGLLPLPANGRYLVTGPAADDIGRQSGGWTITWQGTGTTRSDFPGATSILEGFEAQVSAAGGTLWRDAGAVPVAELDAVIMVYGETPYAEGQGDIDSLAWQQGHQSDLEAIRHYRAQGVPVVSVFVTGRPRWVNAEINASSAFVVAWLPGSEGAGVADVLLANAEGQPQFDMTGRLPFAWPNTDINPEDPELPVTEAAFPAGFGLAYQDAAVTPILPEVAYGRPRSNTIAIFDRGVREPWRLKLVEAGEPAVVAGPAGGRGSRDQLRVSAFDHLVQEDARRIEWQAGREPASVVISAQTPTDLSRLLVRGGVLEFEWRVATAPENVSEPVTLSMACGKDCVGAIDITPLVAAHAEKGWQTVAVPLSCFAEAGADVTAVSTIFSIHSRAAMALDVASITLREKTSASAQLWCPAG